MNRISSLLIVISLLITTALTRTADGTTLLSQETKAFKALTLAQPARIIDRFGGSLGKTLIHRGYAYFSEGSDILTTVDLSNPSHPTVTARTKLPEEMLSAVAVGQYLYLTIRNGYPLSGLAIFDISNPSQPTLVAERPFDWRTNLRSDGHYLYSIDSESVAVWDIIEPVNPLKIGQYPDPESLEPLNPATSPKTSNYAPFAVQDGYIIFGYNVWECQKSCYITGWGLKIINLEDPRNPILVKTTKFDGGFLWDMLVTSNYIYMLGDINNDFGMDLTVWERFDPTEPIGTCYDCLSGSYTDMGLYGNHLYLVNHGGPLQVMDVSVPQQPRWVNTAWIKGYYFATGTGIAVVNDLDTWTVLDLSSPRYPLEIGSLGLPGGVGDLVVTEGRVYILAGECLKIYNFGNYDQHLGQLCQGLQNLVKKGNYIYSIFYDRLWRSGMPGSQTGILAIDVSNPYRPKVLSTYPLEESYIIWGNTKLIGNLLFLYDGRILDISDPKQLSLVGEISLPGENSISIDRIEGWGKYVILSTGQYLYVIDLSDPEKALIANSMEIVYLTKFVVAGDYLYMLQPDNSGKTFLYVFQLNEDGGLLKIGHYAPQEGFYQYGPLSVDGNHIFTIAHRNCDPYCELLLQAVNISDHAQPTLAGAVAIDQEGLNDILFWQGLIFGTHSSKVSLFQFGWRVFGKVADVAGRPFSGVRIAAGHAGDATSDQQGRYWIPYLDEGAQTLAAEKEGYAFWPGNSTVQLSADLRGQDFYILPAPLSGQLSSETATVLSYTSTNGRKTSFTFPAGAWGGFQVQIEPIAFFGAQGLGYTGHAFDLRLGELQELPELVSVTLGYTDFDVRLISAESELSLYLWDGGGWVKSSQTCRVGTESLIDEEQNVLATKLCLAGRYALLGPSYQVRFPLLVPGPRSEIFP
jgi:hypothetical protein